jgi:hypothetical protein
MIRLLSYGDMSRVRALALAAAYLLWLFVCAFGLARVIAQPGKMSLAIAIASIVLPLALVYVARLPIYLLAAYAALVPFSNVLDLTGAGGQTLTKFLGIAVAGSLLLAILAKEHIAQPSKTLLVLVLLTTYAGSTILWAIDPYGALSSYTTYLTFAGLYAVIALYPATASEMRLVLFAAVAGAAALAAYGGYLFWHGQQVYENRLGIGFTSDNWIDPNAYAATLLTPIAVIITMFARSRFSLQKIAWMAMLLVVACGFAVSGSRGGLLALAVVVLFLAVRLRYRAQLLLDVPPLVLVVMASPIADRLLQADLVNADLRADIWKVGVASLHQYWLAGAGIGNFKNAYIQYFLSTPHAALSWDRMSHSILLESAVEYGVPGLVLLLGFWYMQFSDLARVCRNEQLHDLAVALQAGLVGLFVAGLSINIMLAKYTWLTFSLIALVRAASTEYRTPRTEP